MVSLTQGSAVRLYEYGTNQNSQQLKADRNATRALQLEASMFNWRSRHLILVLTLTYKPEWMSTVTLDMLRHHRDQLLNNRRSNQLLDGIKGYVWKIEEGNGSGGLHLHIVIFYSGDHRADIHIARCIGEYWVIIITQGRGKYRNSNADKEKHVAYGHGIGTGQIDRNDLQKRSALQKNLLYLAKNEQHVLTAVHPRLRLFGTSQLPG